METNAVFERNAIRPVLAGEIPENVLKLVMPHVENHECILKAALTCDKEMVLFPSPPESVNILHRVAAAHQSTHDAESGCPCFADGFSVCAVNSPDGVNRDGYASADFMQEIKPAGRNPFFAFCCKNMPCGYVVTA